MNVFMCLCMVIFANKLYIPCFSRSKLTFHLLVAYFCIFLTDRVTNCQLNYDGPYKPICGSDGKTYSNQGVLQITACVKNKPELVKQFKGECEFEGEILDFLVVY